MKPLAIALVIAVTAEARAACGKLECGTNSPIIDSYEFHELHERGLANAAGLRVRDLVTPGGTHYRPDVIGGRLVGRGFMNVIMIEHAGLTGSYLELLTGNGGMYKLYVDHVSTSLPFWVGPDVTAPAESYELTYLGGLATQKKPLCASPPRGTSVPGQTMKESVLFSGERFDATTKTVAPATTGDDTWFNVGCYQSALYKLYLTRHTLPSSAPGYTVDTTAHQAMLKMYVGDVCGNGDSFTVQGTPLYWNNPGAGSWGSAVIGQDVLEGVWGPHGARCIDAYRRGTSYWQSTVVPACGTLVPPTCAATSPSLAPWPAGVYAVTTIPQALP